MFGYLEASAKNDGRSERRFSWYFSDHCPENAVDLYAASYSWETNEMGQKMKSLLASEIAETRGKILHPHRQLQVEQNEDVTYWTLDCVAEANDYRCVHISQVVEAGRGAAHFYRFIVEAVLSAALLLLCQDAATETWRNVSQLWRKRIVGTSSSSCRKSLDTFS